MNTTSFMDKQIMDLSQGSSSPRKDLIDLMNPQNHDDEEHRQVEEESCGNGINTDPILPCYDFHPIRPLAASNFDSAPNLGAAFSKSWNSDSNINPSTPNIKSCSSLDSMEPAKVIEKRDPSAFEFSMLSEIDRTMKKHTDNLLHLLEGVSARLTQIETRSHHLENSIDDLKVSVRNNHGSTDGKLRQLENILQEVQKEVQNIKDNQDIIQAQQQLAKLQVSKTDQQSETQSNGVTDSVQLAASAPLQSHQQLPSPVNLLQSIPVVLPPNAPPQPPPHQALPPPQQGLPSPAQPPNQFSQNQVPAVPQRDPYLLSAVPSQETPTQQYQLPLAPQQPPPQPAAPPHQSPYQQTPHSQYPQPAPHPPQQQPSLSSMNPPQLQSSQGHHVEEPPYVPSQNYPPNLRQPPSQPPTGPPPSQQFYGTPPHGYEPPLGRSGSGYSSGYGTPSGPAEAYRYGGPPQYGGSSGLKPPQLPTASVPPSGGSGYPQLPTARILPQALPTASAVTGGGSGSPGNGNRVSIDDVVDKVAGMGFPRDHVRATVRKLTENGQSVDLNAVLDKLMTDGDVQPPRGWFGR